jgi:hypothetical protein
VNALQHYLNALEIQREVLANRHNLTKSTYCAIIATCEKSGNVDLAKNILMQYRHK